MRHLPSGIITLTLYAMPLIMFSQSVSAQMSNKPFSFGNSGNGMGMSTGGRDAIINEKLYNVRTDNLLRAQNGELLDVQKGPGGSAFASYPGTGQYVHSFGSPFRESSSEQMLGMAGNVVLPALLSFYAPYSTRAGADSAGTISTWTSRVASGMPISYMDGNVVDSWTGQVLIMDVK